MTVTTGATSPKKIKRSRPWIVTEVWLTEGFTTLQEEVATTPVEEAATTPLVVLATTLAAETSCTVVGA